MERVGCDFDGTLVDYGFKPGEPVKVNHELLEQFRGEEITIITNQGGLGFGLMNATRPGEHRKYPTPQDFYDRFTAFVEIAKTYDISVNETHICVYHAKLETLVINDVYKELRALFTDSKVVLFISDGELARKPNPVMLQWAEVTVYFGDSDEDRQAAEAAGVEFRHVERFMG